MVPQEKNTVSLLSTNITMSVVKGYAHMGIADTEKRSDCILHKRGNSQRGGHGTTTTNKARNTINISPLLIHQQLQ